MDIGQLKNNWKYFDDTYFVPHEVTIGLKESPEFNLHIDEEYFWDIFVEPIRDGKPWVGFTRDLCEDKGGWHVASAIEDIDEYINDMLRYVHKQFKRKETPEVFNLVLDFLTYAKQTNQTVVVDVF